MECTSYFLSGKGDVCADKEPKDQKKRKLMPLLEKVEVMEKLGRGMSIATIRQDQGKL
jgi:hypothetical protein